MFNSLQNKCMSFDWSWDGPARMAGAGTGLVLTRGPNSGLMAIFGLLTLFFPPAPPTSAFSIPSSSASTQTPSSPSSLPLTPNSTVREGSGEPSHLLAKALYEKEESSIPIWMQQERQEQILSLQEAPPPLWLQAQLCTHGEGGKAFALPPPGPSKCREPEGILVTEIELDLEVWVPSLEKPWVPAYKCFVETTETITFTSFVNGKSVLESDRKTRRAISASDCRRLEMNREANGTKLKELEKGRLYWTGNTKNARFKWCCSNTITRVENVFLQIGRLYMENEGRAGTHLSSDLADVSGCVITNRDCSVDGGTAKIVWYIDRGLLYCPYKYKGRYRGKSRGDYIVIPTLNAALTLSTELTAMVWASGLDPKCLPKRAEVSEEGLAIRRRGHGTGPIKNTTVVMETTMPKREKSRNMLQDLDLLSHVSMKDPVNAKLRRLVLALEDRFREEFRHQFLTLCLHQEQEVRTLVQLTHIDPTRGARALLGRKDITAVLESHGLLRVFKCHPINITSIIVKHSLPVNGSKCYSYIPVRTEELGLLFLPPGSNDLSISSPLTHCDSYPVTFPTQSEWELGRATFKTVTGPLKADGIHPWMSNHSDHLEFDTPPLFSAVIANPHGWASHEGRLRLLEAQTRNVINYTASTSWNPEVVKETIEAGGAVAEQVLKLAGTGVQNAIKSVGQVGDSFWSKLTKAVVAILLFVLIGATIVLGIYCLINKDLCWSCMRRCKRRKWRPNPSGPGRKRSKSLPPIPLNHGVGAPTPPLALYAQPDLRHRQRPSSTLSEPLALQTFSPTPRTPLLGPRSEPPTNYEEVIAETSAFSESQSMEAGRFPLTVETAALVSAAMEPEPGPNETHQFSDTVASNNHAKDDNVGGARSLSENASL